MDFEAFLAILMVFLWLATILIIRYWFNELDAGLRNVENHVASAENRIGYYGLETVRRIDLLKDMSFKPKKYKLRINERVQFHEGEFQVEHIEKYGLWTEVKLVRRGE